MNNSLSEVHPELVSEWSEKDLVVQALEIQPFSQSDVWDGELDGRMVKIMPVNRIATKADLEELKANLPYKTYEKRKAENPTQPVERITIVCMGHEPDLKAALEQELSEYKMDIEIVDILRDKKDLQLKREAEAEIVREGNKLVIRSFYPMNLMQKLCTCSWTGFFNRQLFISNYRRNDGRRYVFDDCNRKWFSLE